MTSALELKERLGKGHFGEVFRAIDPLHGEVAVKRLTRLDAESAGDWKKRREALLAEGQRLVAARHPNVVQVHYAEPLPRKGGVQLVMELCRGGSAESLYRRGPLSLEQVRRMATESALGLQAVHQRGMLHRDLKPANLLIGHDAVTKLGDFGLVTDDISYGYGSDGRFAYADHVAYETHTTKLTSEKTDIWALGMTIYRLLHGSWWWGAVPEPKFNVEDGGYRDQLPWLPHVPKPWRSFIRKCLNDDPRARYQSAAAVLDALAQLPITPKWLCSVADTTCNASIRWSTLERGRRVEVSWELTVDLTRTVKWEACSVPAVGSGRSKRLGGSTRQSDLERFFASRA